MKQKNKIIIISIIILFVLSGMMVQAQQEMKKKKITELSTGWNIIGIPYNKVVEKTDIKIKHDGCLYSWDEAVINNLIMDDIFGWNRTNKVYELNSFFEPGYGYWMYSYVDCILYLKG